MKFPSLNSLSSASLLSIILLGALAGAGILSIGLEKNPETANFVRTPQFLVWVILIAALFGFLPIAVIQGFIIVMQLRKLRNVSISIDMVWSLVILIALFLLPSIISVRLEDVVGPQLPSDFGTRMYIVIAIAGLCVFPAVIGLILTEKAIRHLTIEQVNFQVEYLNFNQILNNLMFIIGTVIGLGTLATGGLRAALQASSDSLVSGFPPILIVIYGGYFSLMLTLIYLPPRRMLSDLGMRFLKATVPMPAVTDDNWDQEYEKWRKVQEWLNIQKDPIGDLKSGLIVLTPLITGLFSYVFST